ncbi:uncharacterized protein LOC131929390 [Physella acuta]|uniref:uncharacterized protein LOC131929390 n=1 Tax=Physella acuta TaxID=109671 RepID=UPI0027DB37D7|nr:uncharacterized protein LOC131929390 [Physella acuta]XP_059141539.1 uncharacterized protein LOC131929390 [Physella acuta]
MGNRIGGQKQKANKPTKEEKKKEKEIKKEKEKQSKKEKKEKKRRPQASGPDTDFDDSSHVTGGDSESCVFHSAENVSSPYLDACTRSELEQSTTWSSMYESYTSALQHPKVLSSKDFKDGFSLEACIPPEIARPETYDDGTLSNTSRFEGRSSVNSRKSNNSVKSNSAKPRSGHATPTSYRYKPADDVGSVGTSSQASAGGGYHTPLLSTPIFSRVDRPHSPASGVSSPLSRVQESDPNDSMDIAPPTTFHHPHFYNHLKTKIQKQPPASQPDFRHLPKPTSPQPQRRALSPKMTSSPFKRISSDDSSSSPTTPTPQRRATNLLDLLRSGSKGEKSSKNKSENKQAAVPSPQLEGKLGSKTPENEAKIKSKPMWKTWERSAAKKSEKQNKVSIFGTTRKTDKKKCENILGNVTYTSTEDRQVTQEEVSQSLNNDKNKSVLSRVSKGNRTSSKSSDSNLESSSRGYSGNEEEKQNRNSSPPVAKSAAFCIMRLEELERSIEKTIREKFPDAEPFLLRKRSKDDELKGSRSLPSTPSLKKKLYVVRDVDDMKRNSQKDSVEFNLNTVSEKLSTANGNTRVCAETFESSPSPAMSPVVLRRFGARTRHASISPKIPRAKTAALYNSPSEMTQAEESMATKTVTKVPVYHALSTTQVSTPSLSTQFMKPLTPSQKSTSKYDNVMDESEQTPLNNDSPKLVRQYGVEENDSDEVEERTGYDNYPDSCPNPVIVPTFSAVFGSVSPKLRRHLQSKFDDINKQGRKPTVQKLNNNTSYTKPGTVDVKTKQFTAHNTNQQGNNFTSPKGVKKLVPSFPVSPNLNSQKYVTNETGSVNKGGLIQTSRCKETTESATSSAPPTSTVTVTASVSGSPVSVSIKNKMTPLSKSHSEGWKSGTTPASGAVSTNNSSHLYSAGKLHTEATHPVPDQGEMGATLEHPRRVEEVEKSGIHRKHSTDHVIFGSAVALPCRVYTSAPLSPTSPGPERSNNVNISATAPAQETLTSQHKNIRYVKKQKSGLGGDNKRDEQSVAYCSEAVIKPCVVSSAADTRFDLSTHSVPGLNQLHGNDKQHSGDATYEGELTVSKENIVSDPSCKQEKIREIPEWGKSTARDENTVGNRKEDIYVEDVYSKQKSSWDGHIAGRYQSKRKQEEQSVAVLRQPVSKVISEMINISKQEQLRQQQQDKQQGIQQPQANPEYGVKHVLQAVAVVSSPTYEQPCFTLEAKTVRGEVLHVPPVVQQTKVFVSKTTIESRCQEIQTDSYTTADKSVDSNGLHSEPTNRQRESQPLPLIRDSIESRQNAKDKLNEKQDEYSSDESEFLKMVLASKDLERSRNVKDKDAEELGEHAPPPPSPTAVQQLLEEFSDEEEDSDAQERKEIELAMRKESEIKQFTDKIYKRLSNLIGSQEEMDDDVFVADVREKKETKHEGDLGSKYEKKEDSFSSGSDDEATLFTADTSVVSSCDKHLTKVMTIETSSSLTTTTSSDSEIYEEPSKNERRNEDSATGFPKRNAEPNVFIFPEMENAMSVNADDARQRRSSREYHSDDDVATGRGIPDYYDDRPLWSKRQKPPGQLSAAMMAIRRRERRERWLKKRRRNKTDLLSTGSSDNCSEISRDRRSNTYIIDSNASLDYDEDEEFIAHERMILKDEMGSGILTSPKYSKPILPFSISSSNQKEAEPSERDRVSIKIAAERQFYRDHRSKSNSDENRHRRKKRTKDRKKKSSYDNEDVDVDHDISDEILSDESENEMEKTEIDYHPERFSSGSNLVIPGIEETFNELMSVKHILEELQERKPVQSSNAEFMPLTQENVKSVREYYKDCYSSGNGRRSRMSATDRTESDLDIYSETRDDESTDSNFNADDEEDDDGLEPYATADDDHGATDESRSAGVSSEGRRRRDDHHGDNDDDSETNVVVSCTFYNSNAFAAAPDGALLPAPAPVNKPSVKSTPNTLTPTAQASLLNSDEEFWAGNAAADETFKQIETAADSVSSTFQNAREQMHDIQHHLQALRRQMETMQDDLTSTSMTLTPDTSAESHVLP